MLAPGGVLSYFEYMYVRPLRKLAAGRDEKARLQELDAIMDSYRQQYHRDTSWVFVNLPPAWVQHLSKNGCSTSAKS